MLEVIFMFDISGREWTEEEYLRLHEQGLVQEKDVVKVIGVHNQMCERCLNQSDEWFGTFTYKGQLITYCRQCLDFKMVDNCHYLHRSLIPAKITDNAHVLNVDFKLSPLQQQASNFAKDILEANDLGLIWAVCGARKNRDDV